MTDLRFNDVVETTHMTGPDGEYVKGLCKTCSTQRKAFREEFEVDGVSRLVRIGDDGRIEWETYIPFDLDIEHLEYVAAIRSWNCCHDGEEPLDGFPEEPDSPSRIEWGDF